jgi:hypothetical protein
VAIPVRGHPVVTCPFTPEHWRVLATATSAAALPRPGSDAWMTSWLSTDLERFWPSRRGHAFDEFCR